MIKTLAKLLIVIVLLALAAGPVSAQNPSDGALELPATAAEAIGLLLTFIASTFGVGTVTNVIVDALKRVKLPFLGGSEKGRIGGLLAEVVVITVGGLLSWAAVLYLYPWAHYLDSIGIWPIWAAAVPFARWLYWQHKQAQKAGQVQKAGL